MDHFDDSTVNLSLQRSDRFRPEDLVGWTVRMPSTQAKRWSVLHGIAHGLAWAFPFVAAALLWRRAVGPDGDQFWPRLIFAVGMVLLIVQLIGGILAPRFWWFAYRDNEVIIEHGVIIKARDHLAFDRVQYLERRAGPIMKAQGLASLVCDTAAGRAVIPAAQLDDIEEIELRVRAAMRQATVP